jgi:acyl-CoA synthetase (AMP-forming)/AMP-acid ligase II
MNIYSSVIDKLIENQNEKLKGIHFLDKNLNVKQHLSYAEIYQKALSIKQKIENLGIKPGEPVLLVYDQGINFLVSLLGCFMARVIAVPCYPPLTKAMILRFVNIIKTVKPKFVFVDKTTHLALHFTKILKHGFIKGILNWFLEKKAFTSLKETSFEFQIIETSSEIDEPFLSSQSLESNPNDVAFIQYTSGSIGLPKGVIIKQKNLTYNLQSIQNLTHVNKESAIFSWLPQYHDMGLVGCLLLAVYTGCNLYFTSPLNFIKLPQIWLKGISKFKITHSAAPNFAYELTLKKIKEEDKKELDLSSLVAIVNAAEPIKSSTLKKFTETFANSKFNAKSFALCYGLAESTLMFSINHGHEFSTYFCPQALKNNSAVEKKVSEGVPLINCGIVLPEHQLLILDLNNKILPQGKVGEIWISGKSVFDGYWGDSESNRLTVNEHSYFNTGDLGFIYNNNLFVTGRSKDLIIKNGQNFYPQDIEQTAEDYCSFIKTGRSMAFSLNEDENLVFVFEYVDEKDSKNLMNHANQIQLKVLEFLGLKLNTVVAVEKASIPKTTSGKLQRQLMKEFYKHKKLKILSEVKL